MRPRSVAAAALLALGAATVASCNNLPGADPEDIAGDYHSTTLFGTRPVGTGVETVDYMVFGGSVTAHLAADGTITGNLSIPPTSTFGNGTSIALSGTWTFDDPIVEITIPASTWFSGIDWTYSFRKLSGNVGQFGDIAITIVLAK